MKTREGFFITVEGGHGVGKTTLIRGLTAELRRESISVTTVVDLKNTETGRVSRRLMLRLESSRIGPLTEALLIAASRHQNVREIIVPRLAAGDVIISERFNDAFYAFQVSGRGLSKRFIDLLADQLTESIEPDLTFLLDTDPRIALARIPESRKHRIETESLEFHDLVRQGYLSRAKELSRRIHILDAANSANVVLEQARSILYAFLSKKHTHFNGYNRI